MDGVAKRPRSRRRGPGMTGRGPRARDAEYRPLDMERALGGGPRREEGADGSWFSRSVRGSDKTYTCPGCLQPISPGTAHVVAWQADSVMGDAAAVAGRRHWHRACWAARNQRR